MYKAIDMDVLNRQFSGKVKEAHMRLKSKISIIAVAIGAALIATTSTMANVATDYSDHTGDKAELSQADFQKQLLDAHNEERLRVGVKPLYWDNKLSLDAQKWADHLAKNDLFEHANNTQDGENLWMGDSAAYSPHEMVGLWISEVKLFKYGVFPKVSKSADWTDVGHYTQLIWPTTSKLGCAKASSGGNDFLVCRYDPAGNISGFPLRKAL
jgi:Cysteine-rich secretory protein family